MTIINIINTENNSMKINILEEIQILRAAKSTNILNEISVEKRTALQAITFIT